MKDKIKNGYFFMYDGEAYMRVGSRCYRLPILSVRNSKLILFKNIDEIKIETIYDASGDLLERNGER